MRRKLIRMPSWSGQTGRVNYGAAAWTNLCLIVLGIVPQVNAQKIYWSEAGQQGKLGTIRRANVDGTGQEILLEKPVDCPVGIVVDTVAGRVFWAECDSIRVTSFDGSNTTKLLDSDAPIFGLALDRENRRLYWTTTFPANNQGVIRSAELDSTDVVDMPLPGGLSRDLALDTINGRVFWLTHSAILRADIDGSNVQTVVTNDLFAPRSLTFDDVGQALYWSSDYPWATVHRCDADGEGCVEIASLGFGTDTAINGLTFDGGSSKLYWSTGENLYRMEADGANFEELSQPATRVAIADDQLFMNSEREEAILRADLDGANATSIVVSPFGFVNAIALDVHDNRMYLADSTRSLGPDGRIMRSRLDGSQLETLVTGLYSVGGLAIDSVARKLYWTQDRTGNDARIRRSNLDGTDIEDVIVADPSGGANIILPRGIMLDVAADMMYWTDLVTRDVKRARLDGSAIEVIASIGILHQPRGIALEPNDAQVFWTEGSAASPSSQARIARTGVEGGPVVTAVSTASLHSHSIPIGVAINANTRRMYWTDKYARKIQAVDLPASIENVTDVISESLGPYALALDMRVTGGCNGNGIPDECDIDCGPPRGACDVVGCGQSADCNANGQPDECDADGDSDGVPDECDACAQSDQASWIVLEECNTGVRNQLLDDGCTMSDLLSECVAAGGNHGQQTSCIVRLANRWRLQGLISGKDIGRIAGCAGRSNSGASDSDSQSRRSLGNQ